MAELTTQQMAQLMLGVARSQLAILDGIESIKPGFKATHARSILETTSRIRSNTTETLADFPARLLLQMLGRNPPALERVSRDFEALVSGVGTTESTPSFGGSGTGESGKGGSGTGESAAGAGGAGDADSLDMTTPT